MLEKETRKKLRHFLISGRFIRKSLKATTFRACYAGLNKGGLLYIYDVTCREGESREAYLSVYTENIFGTWTSLGSEGKKAVTEHVVVSDFPVSFRELASLAQEAGFQKAESPLYLDKTGFNSLCCFQRL